MRRAPCVAEPGRGAGSVDLWRFVERWARWRPSGCCVPAARPTPSRRWWGPGQSRTPASPTCAGPSGAVAGWSSRRTTSGRRSQLHALTVAAVSEPADSREMTDRTQALVPPLALWVRGDAGGWPRSWTARSPSSARGRPRPTGSTWPATWRTGWGSGAGRSSPAAPTASTRRRTGAPWPRRRRRSPCSPAGSTGSTRPATARCSNGSRSTGWWSASGLRARRRTGTASSSATG